MKLTIRDKVITNRGFNKRTKLVTGILVHSTNGRGNSSFLAEESYLYSSPNVSAHYVVGNDGVTQLLDPKLYVAWHAGNTRNATFSNEQSIGIEVHYSPADSVQPIDQRKIVHLTELVQFLLKEYNLSTNDISTHRAEATPKGRKVDPSFWNDAQFEDWKKSLMTFTSTDTILNGFQTDPIYLHRALNKYSPKLTTAEKENIVSAYTTYGELTTIGNLYPFAQWCHETGYGTSRRWVENRNPAGIGATNDGAEGYKASSIADGILMQYAHLLCYAVPDDQLAPLQKAIARLSPRRMALIGAFGLGSAGNRWVGLNTRWAFPGKTYGNKILEIGEGILRL